MYTQNQIRRFCELATLKSLGDLIKNYEEKSKFGGALKKMDRQAGLMLSQLPKASKRDLRKAAGYLNEWGRVTGWAGKKKSPALIFCFCLRLLDESKHVSNPRMNEVMTDLLNHIDDKGFLVQQHYWAGDLAYTKWLKVFGEDDPNAADPDEVEHKLRTIDNDIKRGHLMREYRRKVYGCKS